MKPKRIVDLDLLAEIRKLPCLACRATPTHPHHVTSRGAGGDDIPENLMPLCNQHHRELHAEGYARMMDRSPAIRYWLELAGRTDVLERATRTRRR